MTAVKWGKGTGKMVPVLN